MADEISEYIQTEITDYLSLNSTEKKTVASLTYRDGHGSGMRDAIFYINNIIKNKKYDHLFSPKDIYNKVVLLKIKNKIIGWAFLVNMTLTQDRYNYESFKYGHNDKKIEKTLHCMFYISKKYRKKGLSKILIKESIKICFQENKIPYVSSWAEPDFFKKFGFNKNGFLSLYWKKKWMNNLL